MKIAFVGTSSTGKTTLITELFKHKDFKNFKLEFLTTNARGILNSMGFNQMDFMSNEQRKKFQYIYFEKKCQGEKNKSNFITDRSFVDVASYWLVRECNYNLLMAEELLTKSETLSKKYDLHFYFPYGIIPFQPDGYRSENENQRKEIGDQMKHFLVDWGIRHVSLDTDILKERVQMVINEIKKICHDQ